ncbi:uncharacterized protein RJT21DRAFT_118624 [Scheffersomyces amazonensis]|uniref:uncharacterized protein n=1 Tax=Scheffersomyces amazonensis TaxID=1078765 RepID=UPI00315D1645
MDVDNSFDNSSLQQVLDTEGFKVDLESLIDDKNKNDNHHDNSDDETRSPSKKKRHLNNNMTKTKSSYSKSFSTFTSILKPDLKDTNSITNELFQVTNQLIRPTTHHSIMSDTEDEDEYEYEGNNNGELDRMFFPNKRLNNDKVEKLVDNLFMKNGKVSSDTFDFELDDQLRTRFYKGRFNKNQFNIEANDEIDVQLNNYLDRPFSVALPANSSTSKNDNKENQSPSPDPQKPGHNKGSNTIKKSSKTFFKPPRERTPNTRQSIPVLKPLTNLSTIDNSKKISFNFLEENNWSTGKRLCSPKHRRNFTPMKPSIKYSNNNTNIFLVESSTGLINDATRFGTELNSSNCEDFPLPEDANEIVQIPTNEDPKSKKQKMAIIKVMPKLQIPSPAPQTTQDLLKGFYSEQEYKKFNSNDLSFSVIQSQDSGVQVVGQSLHNIPDSKSSSSNDTASRDNTSQNRKVRWAENLEW